MLHYVWLQKMKIYIKEFVEYYKNLGIKKIYLYDNNDINGENFNDILNSYINSEFIKVKNIRGKSEIQLLAYNDCYQRYLNEYFWFLFLIYILIILYFL